MNLDTLEIEVMTFKCSGKWYTTFNLSVKRTDNFYDMIQQVTDIRRDHQLGEMEWLIGHKDILDYSYPQIIKN